MYSNRVVEYLITKFRIYVLYSNTVTLYFLLEHSAFVVVRKFTFCEIFLNTKYKYKIQVVFSKTTSSQYQVP